MVLCLILWHSPFRQHLKDQRDQRDQSDPVISTNQLKCYMTNMRSLANKIVELHHFFDSVNPDVLIITESWLDSSIPDSLLVADYNYHIFRKDRLSRGDGVSVLSLIHI